MPHPKILPVLSFCFSNTEIFSIRVPLEDSLFKRKQPRFGSRTAQWGVQLCRTGAPILSGALELRSCNALALHLFIQLPEREFLERCSSETVRERRCFHRPVWYESSWLQPSNCAVHALLKSCFVTMPPESQAEKGMGWSYLLRIWSHMISFKRNCLSAALRQWFAF